MSLKELCNAETRKPCSNMDKAKEKKKKIGKERKINPKGNILLSAEGKKKKPAAGVVLD